MEKELNSLDEEEEGRARLIVLLRHGIAEDRAPGKKDEERALTPEGHARMMKLAGGLERAFPKAQVIYSSPLVRAVQTAQWVAKAYRSRIKITQSEALAPSGTHQDFLQLIRSIPERRIILVGHEPTLTSNTVALLGLTNDSQGLELKKGGCYALRLRGENGAVLDWALSPRILRRLAE
jgi:phosphohistidine phosphatase